MPTIADLLGLGDPPKPGRWEQLPAWNVEPGWLIRTDDVGGMAVVAAVARNSTTGQVTLDLGSLVADLDADTLVWVKP